jgi:hypothetical protein
MTLTGVTFPGTMWLASGIERGIAMQRLVIHVGDDINIGDVSAQIKKLYPSLQIMSVPMNADKAKRFTGIGDLNPLYIDGFRSFQREELHHQ